MDEGYGKRVPKRVDHEERRRQIADALVRTATIRGLHATGMREVAAEAGVSLRLVQYYFGTKEELLLAAMQHLAARFAERATARFREASGSGRLATPRDVIAAILAEARLQRRLHGLPGALADRSGAGDRAPRQEL